MEVKQQHTHDLLLPIAKDDQRISWLLTNKQDQVVLEHLKRCFTSPNFLQHQGLVRQSKCSCTKTAPCAPPVDAQFAFELLRKQHGQCRSCGIPLALFDFAQLQSQTVMTFMLVHLETNKCKTRDNVHSALCHGCHAVAEACFRHRPTLNRVRDILFSRKSGDQIHAAYFPRLDFADPATGRIRTVKIVNDNKRCGGKRAILMQWARQRGFAVYPLPPAVRRELHGGGQASSSSASLVVTAAAEHNACTVPFNDTDFTASKRAVEATTGNDGSSRPGHDSKNEGKGGPPAKRRKVAHPVNGEEGGDDQRMNSGGGGNSSSSDEYDDGDGDEGEDMDTANDDLQVAARAGKKRRLESGAEGGGSSAIPRSARPSGGGAGRKPRATLSAEARLQAKLVKVNSGDHCELSPDLVTFYMPMEPRKAMKSRSRAYVVPTPRNRSEPLSPTNFLLTTKLLHSVEQRLNYEQFIRWALTTFRRTEPQILPPSSSTAGEEQQHPSKSGAADSSAPSESDVKELKGYQRALQEEKQLAAQIDDLKIKLEAVRSNKEGLRSRWRDRIMHAHENNEQLSFLDQFNLQPSVSVREGTVRALCPEAIAMHLPDMLLRAKLIADSVSRPQLIEECSAIAKELFSDAVRGRTEPRVSIALKLAAPPSAEAAKKSRHRKSAGTSS